MAARPLALVGAPGLAACVGLLARCAPRVAAASAALDSGARVASADGGAPPGDDSCSANLRQTRHHVDFKAIARTHSIPPYPTISQRLGEQGTSQLQVAIDVTGSVTDCKVSKSSGSERLDAAACEYVKGHWKWQPPTQEGKPVAANTLVDVVWNLKNAQ